MKPTRRNTERLAALVLFAVLCSGPTFAQAQERLGAVVGTARDAETGAVVPFTQVLLEEANRSAVSDAEGRFVLENVPAGLQTLKAFRIGYAPLIRNVEVPAGDTLRLVLRLSAAAVEVGELVVEGARNEAQQLADVAMELEGQRLRQHLGTTIAETLDDEPGIAMRSMGPAPARPVMRGLGGERLLVLEDGGRTGDLSATSSDHALVVDPMTAERIEVVRGPAALVYGPNTLGGVVNVVRDYIPSSRPEAVHAQFSAQGQSASTGMAVGAALSAPVGPQFAIHADASYRGAQNVDTPEGALENTGLNTANASLGASLVQRWGYVGLAGSYYATNYGIPGGFVGAHPDGVTIELERQHLEARSELLTPFRWMPRIEARGTFSRYYHQEFESSGSLGIEYGLLSYHARVVARTAQYGPFRKGAVGVWAEFRDYAAGGFSSTPPSTEYTLAGFAYQDVHLGDVTLQGGLRYDLREVRPRTAGTSGLSGDVRTRRFGGISASATALVHPAEAVTLGATAMRALRMPGIEELFSEGPHLAAYAFEVGNTALPLETGLGAEIFARYGGRGVTASAAAFVNDFDSYIFPRDTGTTDARVFLPVYQYTGVPARMAGAEASLSVRLLRGWRTTASGSYVRGTLTDTNEPIPWMPPLQGTLGLQWRQGRLTLGADLRLAAEQARVGAFEQPTDGYAVVDVYAQYYVSTGGLLHTFDLGVENVTDTAYRDHLARVKSIMPEPGRNIKLLYKLLL